MSSDKVIEIPNSSILIDKSAIQPKLYNKHFEWVDILRGLAAVGVMLYHARVDLWVGWNAIKENPKSFSTFDRLIAWLSCPLPFLGSTVMLFFILSGFVIYYPVALKNELELKSYYIRRFMRIFPPYLAAVLIGILIEIICTNQFGYKGSNVQTILKTVFMVQNYPPNQGQMTSNPSLWSLPVEAELYIFFPLIFMISNYWGKKTTILAVAFISLIALCVAQNYLNWMTGNFLLYWIIWCSGSFLAHLAKGGEMPRWRFVFGITMLIAFSAAIVITIKGKSAGIEHFVWATGYFFLLWFLLTLPPPAKFFSKKILKVLLWLGKISFSIYLIHFPIFRLLGGFWISNYGHKPSNLLICFFASCFAIFFANIFYKTIEKPFHLLARKMGAAK